MKILILMNPMSVDSFFASYLVRQMFHASACVMHDVRNVKGLNGRTFDHTKNFHSGHVLNPENLRRFKEVYVLGVSWDQGTMQHIIDANPNTFWIDYRHEALEMYYKRPFKEGMNINIRCHDKGMMLVDPTRSTSHLVYEAFYHSSNGIVPKSIRHVSDHVTNKNLIKGTKEFIIAVMNRAPWHVDSFDVLFPMEHLDQHLNLLYIEGDAIQRFVKRGIHARNM